MTATYRSYRNREVILVVLSSLLLVSCGAKKVEDPPGVADTAISCPSNGALPRVGKKFQSAKSTEELFKEYVFSPLPESVSKINYTVNDGGSTWLIYITFGIDPKDLDRIIKAGKYQENSAELAGLNEGEALYTAPNVPECGYGYQLVIAPGGRRVTFSYWESPMVEQ